MDLRSTVEIYKMSGNCQQKALLGTNDLHLASIELILSGFGVHVPDGAPKYQVRGGFPKYWEPAS